MNGQGSSPREKIIIAIGLTLPAACAALLQIRSYDFWWHLETGEQILSQGIIPGTDLFSFTSSGQPWVDQPWLFQILLQLVWGTLGPVGITLMKMASAVLVGVAGYGALRRSGAMAGPSLLVVALCLAGLRSRLAERPSMVTPALAALSAWLLIDLAARGGHPGRRLLLLGLTAAVWSNLHGGALLAPIMAGVVMVGTLLQRPASGVSSNRNAPGRGAILALPVTAAGVLCSPALFRIYSAPVAIAEALAPGNLVNPEWLPPPLISFPLFYGALAISLLLVVTSLSRHRMPGYSGALLFLLASVMALTSARHIGIFFALIPIVLAAVRPLFLGYALPLQFNMAGVAALCALMLFSPPWPAEIGIGIQAGRYPERAADFIDRELPDATLYNDASFGGYLIWRGYPARRVFLDGRNEVHRELLSELSRAIDDGRRWNELLDRYKVEGAVVRYRPESIDVVDAGTGSRSRSAFSELHFPAREWSLVYWDDVAMVFVRRGGRFERLADEGGYGHVRPEAWRLGLVETEQSKADDALKGEIRRKLEEDPECILAKEMDSVYRTPVNPDRY